MQCRVCGSSEVAEIGAVEYYSGFAWPVFDCVTCSCRFTQHDHSIYNRLHSSSTSIYALYRALAEKTKKCFDGRDLSGLRRELCTAAKYQFIIDSVERQGRDVKVLEVGCSRGYLTSYFILAGYNVTGVDASPSAVAAAREAFGDHFIPAGSAAIHDGAPYDVIYHVGTIGCVKDPLGLTQDLFEMLETGGKLMFNAPNASGCWLKGQLWLDASPPPDLVTLFRPGFWRDRFSTVADVDERVELCPSDQALSIGLKQLLGRSWQRPIPLPLDASATYYQNGRPADPERNGRFWNTFERGSLALARLARLSRLAPSQPTPFGLFVTLTKK